MTATLWFLAAGLLGWAMWLRRRVARLEQEAQEKSRQKEATIRLLDKIGESLTTRLEMEPALEIIADYMIEATDAEAGAVFLLDKSRRFLTARVVRGLFPPLHAGALSYVLTKQKYLAEKVKADRIRLGEGVIGLVAEQGRSILIVDCQSDPRVPKAAADFPAMNSLMAAPLRIREEILGVFAVVNKRQGLAFNEQDVDLLQALADQAAVTVDLVGLVDEVARKQRYEQELRLAQEFQLMLLPKKCPDVPGFALAAFSMPALEVGGDFYDFIPLGDRLWGIVIADVSGKGMPAALIMAMARSALRAEARQSRSPRCILQRLNQRFLEDTKENVFITMTYGILDAKARTFRFARAGHEPLVLCPAGDGEASLRTPKGIALGMVEAEVFDLIQEDQIAFSPGETAVLYTDGAVEAMDAKEEEYGHERLYRGLRKRPGRSCQELVQDMVQDIRQFCSQAPQHDDITLVAIQALDQTAGPEARGSAEQPLKASEKPGRAESQRTWV